MIIIDGTALAMKTLFGNASKSYNNNTNLSTSHGQHTEIIYTFLKQLLAIIQNIQINHRLVVFAWDSKDNKESRKALYPEYKEQRKGVFCNIEKEAFEQISIIQDSVIPCMGFKNNIWQKEREADDVIASLVSDYKSEEDIVIVANDKDLYQLLDDNVSMYKTGTKNKGIYSYFDFQQEYGITAKQWVEVKARAGCFSDNIKGIKGVGEKSVCKYLNNSLKTSSVCYNKIESSEGKAIRERNIPLVKLPFKGTLHFDLVRNELTEDKFAKVFEKYEFESFLSLFEFNKWVETFNLKMNGRHKL